MTDPSASQRDQIDELAESFVARFRAGERPSIDEYARKYPDLAEELRELLPALVMLEQHGSLEDAQGLGVASAQRPAPREMGDFTIVREIGRGGMGIVYEAVQQSLGRHVALKVLSSPGLMNPVHLERFRLEARSAGRLHHSHIVPVFGVGEHQGLHYYAMQFIAGQSLDQVIEALRKLRPGEDPEKTAPLAQDDFTHSLTDGLLTGRFPGNETAEGNGAAGPAEAERHSGVSDRTAPPATAQPTSNSFATHSEFTSSSSGRPFYDSVARVGLQVAEALAYAHAEGILHRDIKPSNLLLDAKGNTWVTDFGLAKAEENEALTETGDFVGTLRYMAPERLEGWSDRRSDIYGLGATLYELLTLRPFFESSSRAQLIDDIRHQRPQAPTKIDPAIPRDLETIVLKALSKEPASRYHTAEAMADDLRRFLADRPILARRSTPRERFVRWCRHNPAVASLTAAVAVALVAGTIASTWQAIRATRAERLAEERLGAERKARAAEEEQRDGLYRAWEADSLSQLAQILAAGGHAQEAAAATQQSIDLYERIVTDYPKNGFAHHAVAGIYLQRGNLSKALEEARIAARQSPENWLPHDRLREVLNRIGDAKQTLEVMGENARLSPDSEPAHHQYGIALKDQGRLQEAVHEFERGLEILPNTPWSYYRIAEIRLRQNKLPEALDAARSAVRMLPTQYECHARLLEVLNKIGNPQQTLEVLKDYEALTKENPSSSLYRLRLATALGVLVEQLVAAGQQAEADATRQRVVQIWEALLAENPQDRQAREQLTSAITDAADKAQAKSEMQEPLHRRALALHADLAREIPGDLAHFEQVGNLTRRLGWLLRDKGDLEEARQCFDKAADAFSKLAEDQRIPQRDGWNRASQVDSLGDLARILAASDANEAAAVAQRHVDVCQTLTKEYPGKLQYQQRLASALGFLGERLAAIGQHDEANAARQRTIKVFEALLAEHPTDRPAREQLALVMGDAAISLQDQSNRDLCEPFLRRALAMRIELAKEFPGEPSHAEHKGHFYRRLGWFLRDTGKLEDAHKNLQQAAETFEKLAADKIPQRDGYYRAFHADTLLDLTHVLAASDANEAAAVAERHVDVCQTLTEEYPGNLQYQQRLASALDLLAERLAAAGQNDEAEAARQRAFEIWEALLAENPQDRQAREQLASALAEAADRSQANPAVREPLLRRALALHTELANEPAGNPGHLESTGHLHRNLAWLERSQGRLDEARQDFDKGAKAFAKLAADKIPQRDGYYRAFHADTLIHLAITLTAGGHAQEAGAAARRSVELCEILVSEFTGNLDYRQKLSWAVQVLAQRLVAAGQPQDAVQTCRRQISFCEKLQPDHPQVDFKPQLAAAYLALCSALTSASQIDEAQQAWEKAVEMGLSDANALNEFAWNLVAARDVEPALAALAVKAAQQAANVAPNDAMIRNTLGVAQYRAGSWADAVGSLAKAEELAPGKYLAFDGFFLAMAHWQLDHKDEARTWYDRSVDWMDKNQPKNEELIRFRAEAEQLLGIAQPSPKPKHAPQGDPVKPGS